MRKDYPILVFLICVLHQCCGLHNFTINDCTISEPSCLRCGHNGCMKCPNLIVYPSRKCVNRCPFGHKPKWSTLVDFMGLICTHNGNPFGLSANASAVLIGVLFGVVFSVIMLSSVAIYIRYRRNRLMNLSDSSSETDDSPERKDFLKRLETLRPYAQNYLDMLNDTRRQLRELHREGDNNAISAYKPVVRDLAKILLLLNKPIEKITVPDDWEHLLNWAEKALKRYKRMSEISQPQVAQLINFLQSPIISSDSDDPQYSVRGSTTMSTFKPDQVFGSSLSLQEIAVNSFNAEHDSKYLGSLNPQWKFEYSLVGNSSEFDPTAWRNSKEFLNGGSLFLDDDFYQLGFRPQDEITTEL